MSKPLGELCCSKKFLVLIVTIATYILVRAVFDIPQEEAGRLVTLVAVWLGAQGASDFGKAARPIGPGSQGNLRLVN